MTRYLVAVLSIGLLVACGGKQEEAEGVVPDHMIESMDRAEQVEDVLKQAEQERREQGDNQ